MNAIIGLCHFCEAHGPKPIFCTFVTDDENHTKEPTKCSTHCNGCASLGPDTVFVTKDDNGNIFCSRESIANAEVNNFLRQAAIRSITCEVNWSKDGGAAYFSETQGHVASYMFRLQDTRARGLKRWFSIIVLMKDQMFLLTLMPILTEYMQKIASELQQLAESVYNEEQKVCSQRALRLRTGRIEFGQSRSLVQLTGDEDIFKKLHLRFAWMLKTGGESYSETLYTSEDLLKKLSRHTKSPIFEENCLVLPNEENIIPLRTLQCLVSQSVMQVLMYCTLTGVKLVINTSDAETIARGLLRLSPIINNSNIKTYSDVSTNCCLIETNNEKYIFKWNGELPKKLPTVMIKIESAIQNNKLNNDVLHQHVKSLILEWKGIAKTMQSAVTSSGTKSTAVTKLKQIVGVTKADEILIDYWISLI